MKRAAVLKGTERILNVRVAETFFSRMKGLLGTSSLTEGTGLWLEPCNSVHMWGMRYPLDVLFLDKLGAIVAIREDLRPGQATRIYWKARVALELPAGEAGRLGLNAGDRLRRQEIQG